MKPFATYERKGEKKKRGGKRERRWHIRWRQISRQYSHSVFCMFYTCVRRWDGGGGGKGEKRKKKTPGTPSSGSDNFLPLQLIEGGLRSLLSGRCWFMAVCWKTKDASLPGWVGRVGGCGLWTVRPHFSFSPNPAGCRGKTRWYVRMHFSDNRDARDLLMFATASFNTAIVR